MCARVRAHTVHVHYLMKSLIHPPLPARRPLVPVLVQKWMLLILASLRISECVRGSEKEREKGERGRREDTKRERGQNKKQKKRRMRF